MMKTFESLPLAEQGVVREMANAARTVMSESGLKPRGDDHAAHFDEACAKFYVACSERISDLAALSSTTTQAILCNANCKLPMQEAA